MTPAIFTKTVKDSCSITIDKADFTKKVGEFVSSPDRDVPYCPGLQWSFACYPAGDKKDAKGHLCVFISVTGPVKVDVTFELEGTDIQYGFDHRFECNGGQGLLFSTHDGLMPHFRDDKITMSCSATFKKCVPSSHSKHRIFESSDDVPTDCELVVGTDSVKVHKNLLQFIAPGLYAGFTYNTVESRSGRVIITDFDFEIVKVAMDYFYGRELEDDLSIETVIGILRFADKYNIKSTELENTPFDNITEESFCTIAQYAFDCCKDSLFAECCEFFEDHQDNLKTNDQFAKLPLVIIVRILESTFDLQDVYEVLRHAQIPGVIDYLEGSMVASLSLENFCDTTKYTWDFNREDLKMKCAKFFYDNRTEITIMPAFHELGNTVVEVMKASLVSK